MNCGFLQFFIFLNATKQKFDSSTKYNEYYTSEILYIFAYYAHSVRSCIYEFPTDL